jgi:hypothetical protein
MKERNENDEWCATIVVSLVRMPFVPSCCLTNRSKLCSSHLLAQHKRLLLLLPGAERERKIFFFSFSKHSTFYALFMQHEHTVDI